MSQNQHFPFLLSIMCVRSWIRSREAQWGRDGTGEGGGLSQTPIKGSLSKRLCSPKKERNVYTVTTDELSQGKEWVGLKESLAGAAQADQLMTETGPCWQERGKYRAAANVPHFLPFRGGLGRASCTFRTSG